VTAVNLKKEIAKGTIVLILNVTVTFLSRKRMDSVLFVEVRVNTSTQKNASVGLIADTSNRTDSAPSVDDRALK